MFLEKEGSKAHVLFREIKQSYDWRSKIVHGLRVSKIKDEERDQLLSQSEELLRRIVLLILSSPTWWKYLMESIERSFWTDWRLARTDSARFC